MLTALLDQANVLYFLLGTVALGFFVYGWLTARVRYWAYGAAALGLIGVVWLLTQLVVTDRRQIERNIQAMARAAVEQKPDDMLKHVSREFRFGGAGRGLGRDELAALIRQQVQTFQVNDVHTWDHR